MLNILPCFLYGFDNLKSIDCLCDRSICYEGRSVFFKILAVCLFLSGDGISAFGMETPVSCGSPSGACFCVSDVEFDPYSPSSFQGHKSLSPPESDSESDKNPFHVYDSQVVSQSIRDGRLFQAIQTGSLAEVNRFLNEGACVNALDSSNESALMMAVQRGNAELVSFLLAQGADRKYACKGSTAYDYAHRARYRHLFDLLNPYT